MAVVLIAEDHEEVSILLQRILTRAGFTVLAAPDGTTALQMTLAHHPDVVLTDLDMPGLTGLELAEALRRHPDEHDTPIMILSGSLHPGDPRAAEATLCRVMLKPFANADLVAAVRDLVEVGRHRHDVEPSPCPLLQRHPQQSANGPLAESLIKLAGTTQDTSAIDSHLTAIAQLAADRVGPADYASITATRDGAYTTVAANSALARAVDDAQYAEDAGPCVQAVNDAAPVAVPDITATMTWPGFRDIALSLGLQASLSIPLLAADSTPIAVLNLHGRDATTMAVLITKVWNLYNHADPLTRSDQPQMLDPGSEDLLTGLAAALHIPRHSRTR